MTGEVFDPDTLDRLLPALPEKPVRSEYQPGPGSSEAGFALEDWMDRFPEARADIIEERDDEAARVKYAVACPWADEHTEGDVSGTYVGQFDDGALFFHCHHGHCEGRAWRGYRAFHESGERSEDGERRGEPVGVTGANDANDTEGYTRPVRDTSVSSVTLSAAGVSHPEAASRAGGDAMRDTVTPVTGGLLSPDAPVGGSKFPVHVLPPTLRRFVLEAAHAKETPVEFVALPLLVALGTAIGASRRFRIERTWREYPTLYAATVAPPASGKSPAEDAAMEPVERQKKTLNQEHRLALEKYKQEYQAWEVEAKRGAQEEETPPPESRRSPRRSAFGLGTPPSKPCSRGWSRTRGGWFWRGTS